MKKYFFLFLSLVVATTSFVSCTKDEDDNKEADIISATIPNAKELLSVAPVVKNNTIVFRLKNVGESKNFAPVFELSEGAVIVPASGTLLDFTTSQTYVVTSKDGKWTKEYTVSFVVEDDAKPYYYSSFEYVDTIKTEGPEGIYHQFYELTSRNEKLNNWGTANDGYNIMAATLLDKGEELSPEVYPTVQIKDGFAGKGVKMKTRGTGQLGVIFGSPLAAGNLFVGNFTFSMPTIESTHFGQPYNMTAEPKRVIGYFKYKAGDEFKANNSSSLTKDSWDAYALLFEAVEEKNYLTGSHGFRDERIVSIARIDDAQRVEAADWTKFEMEFKLVDGKSYDPAKKYMYTIVFTSSIEGDKFNGAIGSELCIDEVVLLTE